MNLILFGFKGCGKSHFGKLLAKELHRPFLDTDDLVCALYTSKTKEQLNCSQIHQKLGEKAFRLLESEALLTLKEVKNAIIALGGGAILAPENAAFLMNLGALAYLEASPDTIKKRMRLIPSFLDQNDFESSFHKMIQERTPLYESTPAYRIRIDELDEAGVLAALTSILLN